MADTLANNPFPLLGASVRDSERRIVELMEERAASEESDAINAAGNALRNPRSRLSAEIAWLPGVSPSTATGLLRLTRELPERILSVSGLPSLARVNLIASVTQSGPETFGHAEWTQCLLEFGRTEEKISPEYVLRDINEDRSVAGIPVVRSVDSVVAELAARRGDWQRIVLDRLDTLSSQSLCEILVELVETLTQRGESHASAFLDELLGQYEVRATAALDKGAAGIRLVIKEIQAGSSNGEEFVMAGVRRLGDLLRQWTVIAKPMQVAYKSRGERHELSSSLAAEVRELSLHLWKNGEMLAPVQAITTLMSDVFIYLPVMSEALQEDSKALAERAEEREFAPYLKSLSERFDQVAQSAAGIPAAANARAEELLASVSSLKAEMQQRKLPQRLTPDVYDQLAVAAVRCAFEHGTATSRWGDGVSVATRALAIAQTTSTKTELEKALVTLRQREKRMRGLKHVKSAPTLTTYNGMGGRMYGETDRDPEDGTYITTYYFVFLFIPIVPIARYRVFASGNSYRFIGKAPLRTVDRWHIAVVVAIILGIVIQAIVRG